MSGPRISASSYSNTAPLIWAFLYGSQRGKYEIILDNAPARSAELLAQSRVDCALVPVIEYQRIDDVLLVPEVCVGARTSVRSVCLITNGCDLESVSSVALDESSKTSVALTKIVFREFLGKEPQFTSAKPDASAMLRSNDCALLIGDPALSIVDGENGFRKFDLVEVWRKFTGFGFVFAMWMARRTSAEMVRMIDFAEIRNEGIDHLPEIIANYEPHLSLGHEEFEKYLSQNISYEIDAAMQNGLELFYELSKKHNLIPKLKPLKFL